MSWFAFLTIYWVDLLLISVLFFVLERVRPWREQSQLRPGLVTDIVYLAFNGHFIALVLAPAIVAITPFVDGLITPILGQGHLGASYPLWVQGVVVFFLIDFLKWCVHVMLHHVPSLWKLHQVHHSIIDMDWLGNMRFHWMEIVIYKSLLYIPLLLLGLNGWVLFAYDIFSTIMGHFNHSNLKVELGPFKYLLNHPGMHIWHHDHVLHFKAGCNFGINLSLWDWIFRTAYYPADQDQPAKLGFPGIKQFPRNFVTQQLYPITAFLNLGNKSR